MSVLTCDLGTAATTAVLWSPDGPLAMARSRLATSHYQPGWAEQDPGSWWASVVVACGELRSRAPDGYAAVEAIGFSAARETFVPVASDGHPLGLGIVWSDRRATVEAEILAREWGGARSVWARTGTVLDAGSVPAKVAWLVRHDPDRLRRTRWLLAPRDLVVARLTGEVVTDRTVASRTGFYDLDGTRTEESRALAGNRLPAVVHATAVVGTSRAAPAGELSLPSGIPVVVGASDRACEVLGTGADDRHPLAAWGALAHLSVPAWRLPEAPPSIATVSRGALGGYVVEAVASGGATSVAWLAELTSTDPDLLAKAAAETPAGARGVVALPWLEGARAPWWRPASRAAFLGLAPGHRPGDLGRAVIEAVALDVARSSTKLAPGAEALVASGRGSAFDLWRHVLGAAAGLPVSRRSGHSASAGACLVVGHAVDAPFALDAINPVTSEERPDPRLVDAYRAVERRTRGAVRAVARLEI